MLGHKCSSELSESLFSLPLSPFMQKQKTNKETKKTKTNLKTKEKTKNNKKQKPQRNTTESLCLSAHSSQESQQALLIFSVSVSLVYLVYIYVLREISAKVTRIRLMFHWCVVKKNQATP